MHLDHMPDDEREDDHPGRPLERVADVAVVWIRGRVGHHSGDDRQPDDRVKQDRDEDERPFDDRQEDPQRMDAVHLSLIRRRAVKHRRIRQQVHDQIRPDRNQPGQRKQPVDQELMPAEKRRTVAFHGKPLARADVCLTAA